MIIKPSGMSRRGFLQGLLGLTACTILPIRRVQPQLVGFTVYEMLGGGIINISPVSPADRIRGVSCNFQPIDWEELELELIGAKDPSQRQEIIRQVQGQLQTRPAFVSTPKKTRNVLQEACNG